MFHDWVCILFSSLGKCGMNEINYHFEYANDVQSVDEGEATVVIWKGCMPGDQRVTGVGVCAIGVNCAVVGDTGEIPDRVDDGDNRESEGDIGDSNIAWQGDEDEATWDRIDGESDESREDCPPGESRLSDCNGGERDRRPGMGTWNEDEMAESKESRIEGDSTIGFRVGDICRSWVNAKSNGNCCWLSGDIIDSVLEVNEVPDIRWFDMDWSIDPETGENDAPEIRCIDTDWSIDPGVTGEGWSEENTCPMADNSCDGDIGDADTGAWFDDGDADREDCAVGDKDCLMGDSTFFAPEWNCDMDGWCEGDTSSDEGRGGVWCTMDVVELWKSGGDDVRESGADEGPDGGPEGGAGSSASRWWTAVTVVSCDRVASDMGESVWRWSSGVGE